MVVAYAERVGVALLQVRISARQVERIGVLQLVAQLFDSRLLGAGRVVGRDAVLGIDRVVERDRRTEASEYGPVVVLFGKEFILVEQRRVVLQRGRQEEFLGESSEADVGRLGRVIPGVVVGQRGVDLAGVLIDGDPFRAAVFVGDVIVDRDVVLLLDADVVPDVGVGGSVVAVSRIV